MPDRASRHPGEPAALPGRSAQSRRSPRGCSWLSPGSAPGVVPSVLRRQLAQDVDVPLPALFSVKPLQVVRCGPRARAAARPRFQSIILSAQLEGHRGLLAGPSFQGWTHPAGEIRSSMLSDTQPRSQDADPSAPPCRPRRSPRCPRAPNRTSRGCSRRCSGLAALLRADAGVWPCVVISVTWAVPCGPPLQQRALAVTLGMRAAPLHSAFLRGAAFRAPPAASAPPAWRSRREALRRRRGGPPAARSRRGRCSCSEGPGRSTWRESWSPASVSCCLRPAGRRAADQRLHLPVCRAPSWPAGRATARPFRAGPFGGGGGSPPLAPWHGAPASQVQLAHGLSTDRASERVSLLRARAMAAEGTWRARAPVHLLRERPRADDWRDGCWMSDSRAVMRSVRAVPTESGPGASPANPVRRLPSGASFPTAPTVAVRCLRGARTRTAGATASTRRVPLRVAAAHAARRLAERCCDGVTLSVSSRGG